MASGTNPNNQQYRIYGMSSELIPFGKHQGKPVESLAGDKQYADWLVKQPWFREKHPQLYTIVINNFSLPDDTPEHNTLQARFFDNEFCLALFRIAFRVDGRVSSVSDRVFEPTCGGDVLFRIDPIREYVLAECKPDLGDDYPAVLRQMKRSHGHPSVRMFCLLVRSFRSDAIDNDQLRLFFKSSNIAVIFESEVDAVLLRDSEFMQSASEVAV